MNSTEYLARLWMKDSSYHDVMPAAVAAYISGLANSPSQPLAPSPEELRHQARNELFQITSELAA